jgi:hypothetical protein
VCRLGKQPQGGVPLKSETTSMVPTPYQSNPRSYHLPYPVPHTAKNNLRKQEFNVKKEKITHVNATFIEL